MRMLLVAVWVAAAPVPPVAKKVPVASELHGVKRVDDYDWLRKKGSPEVETYLRAENAYTQAVLAPLEPLRQKLYAEMVARVPQTDVGVPFREHGWRYFWRIDAGKEQAVLYRKKASADGGPEVVLLDLNALRGASGFVELGAFEVSHDGNLMAYTLDTTGLRDFTLHVKDLRTGKLLVDTARPVESLAWALDNRTLFFSTLNAARRADRVYRHAIGGRDVLVMEEKDERFDVSILLSADESQVLMNLGSTITNEFRALDARTPEGPWRTVLARRNGREGDVDHRGGAFYLRINDTGRNFRLARVADADASDEARWREVIPHRDDVMLTRVVLFKDFYVAFERENALPRLRVVDWASGVSTPVVFSEPVFSVWPAVNAEFDTSTFRYNFTSLITPQAVFERDVKTGAVTLLKQEPVVGGYNPDDYAEERLWFPAADGVKVPVSLVYKKGRPKDGTGPLLLDGYGAYGTPDDVTFEASALSLLDRGVAIASAHVRGGDDLGTKWHDAGRMMTKRTTFTDFISVCEGLIAAKVCAKDKLVITGASAGGLLMGAVLNMRPDLFKAAVVLVPFVDVVNTMLDESLPLTVSEFEEWGNPKVKAEFDYLMTYSPYDNVAKKAYPAMLVRSAYNDSQVMYWEPAKWVAKLRANKTDSNPLLLNLDMAAGGHLGKSGRFEQLRDTAAIDAFELWQMGLAN
jgi:oligopeptidase B